jgi:hypothetical protein
VLNPGTIDESLVAASLAKFQQLRAQPDAAASGGERERELMRAPPPSPLDGADAPSEVDGSALATLESRAAAFGLDGEGRAALDRMSGDTDDGARRLTSAIVTVAPLYARMRRDIGEGALHPLDIADDVARAAQNVATALRDSKTAAAAWESLSGQGELGLGKKSLAGDIQAFMVENRGNRSAVEEALSNYVEAAYLAGDPRQDDMFGGPTPTREALWKIATDPAKLASRAERHQLATQALVDFGERARAHGIMREIFEEATGEPLENWKWGFEDNGPRIIGLCLAAAIAESEGD